MIPPLAKDGEVGTTNAEIPDWQAQMASSQAGQGQEFVVAITEGQLEYGLGANVRSKSKPTRGVKAMSYLAPGGTTIIDPTIEALEPIIFGERNGYWRCGCGSSSLGVVEHFGTQLTASIEGEPTLMFFLVERYGFFFIHFQPTRSITPAQFVPFAGGDCRPWVQHNIGGDNFYAPRACFVSRPFAWEVVQEFLRSKGRSPAVPWADRFSLEFPNPAAGDKPPSKKELV